MLSQLLNARLSPVVVYNLCFVPILVCSTDGSVVEFSPATRETRVQFPVSARFFFPLFFFSLPPL